MCIYNESIYSILNLKDVDSTLINAMLFWWSIKIDCNIEETLHLVWNVENLT